MTGLGGYQDSLWPKLGVWGSLKGMKVGGPSQAWGLFGGCLRRPSPQRELARWCPGQVTQVVPTCSDGTFSVGLFNFLPERTPLPSCSPHIAWGLPVIPPKRELWVLNSVCLLDWMQKNGLSLPSLHPSLLSLTRWNSEMTTCYPQD